MLASVQILDCWGSVPAVLSSSLDRTPRNILPCSQPPTLSASEAHHVAAAAPRQLSLGVFFGQNIPVLATKPDSPLDIGAPLPFTTNSLPKAVTVCQLVQVLF